MTIKRMKWLDLGRIDYEASYIIQEQLHRKRKNGEVSDIIIFQECNPVITIGTSGTEDHLLLSKKVLLEKGIDVVYCNRGGDITYHGPGQLVISPVLNIRNHGLKILQYIRLLEQSVINLLSHYEVIGKRIEGASGVWVNGKKIASVGIAIKNGITLHGIALNIRPDLSHFGFIIPCGLKDVEITSLEHLNTAKLELDQVRDDFLKEFALLFDVCIEQEDMQRGGY
ncbi:lipoyl(octanoyl) transferase [Geosporobacter subterraneus DSM 17957]|uniref:Octanoyltransferase n=1 Tax=Geosporobacter subterraneus DSM 17957 TaxID=1121919 RepID=A0A1M6K6D5_9FIRM|nr:lipoyl(octanoyl) transferase LipB [Geosporobacter subterraneus]SHJ54360.1 lipoyl(octanoyl) transferase [Geosporobacter subterraneus DSM 17957]